jgi:hypothetical protein
LFFEDLEALTGPFYYAEYKNGIYKEEADEKTIKIRKIESINID